MKLITAIIQPPKLDAVVAALAKVGVERLTVCDAMGYGRQRGRTEMYRGHEYKTNLLRKVDELEAHVEAFDLGEGESLEAQFAALEEARRYHRPGV